MLHTVARATMIGIVAAGAILSASGVAAADTQDGSAPTTHTVAVKPGIVSVMAIPPRPVPLPPSGAVMHTDDWIANG
ncbi:MAG: hypothetical protein U1D00_07150 [Mycobacterium sp.]|nr:hypothetical protein [Mycobacterium sp.]